MRILSVIYIKIIELFNNLENHDTQSKYYSSLTVKILIFEFFNNFFSFFYIGFFKKSIEGQCENNSCENELYIQTYTILAITVGLNVLELGVPYIIF
jgi:hypothetical protein